MAITLVATVGSATANSYLTVADAEDLFELRFGADAWTSASADDKAKALASATKMIDRCRFRGWKQTTEQALEFPRTVQQEPADEIPAAVLNATVEQALTLLTSPTTGGVSKRKQLQAQGVTAMSVGNLSEQYGKTNSSGGAEHLCSEAADYLKRWISRTGRVIGAGETVGETRPWFPFR